MNAEMLPIAQPPSQRSAIVIAVILFIATLALYAPAVRYGFIAFDDYKYVASNHDVITGLNFATVGRAFNSLFYTNYSPLLIFTELLISTLFGPGPAGFHAVNVVLHSVNAVLVFQFFRLTGGRLWVAAVAAAVWAWHPLRVESVAWISELKDELCGLFWLLTMLAYVGYARRPTWGMYLVVFASCLAAFASKPMAVTLPFVLILLDVYPLRRSERRIVLILEKLPLISMTILWSYLTTLTSTKRLHIPVLARLENAVVSIGMYLRDCVAPRNLAVFYPHPTLLNHPVSISAVAVSGTVVIIISLLAIHYARRGQLALLIGWLWFLGTLVPVLGFTQGNEAARADRYTYLPTLGLLAAAVWTTSLGSIGLGGWLSRRGKRNIVVLISVTTLAVECRATVLQLQTWKSTETVFSQAIAATEYNYLAYSELANVRRIQHRDQEALEMADRSLAIKPNNRDALASKALILIDLNRHADALRTLRLAIQVDPTNAVLSREAGHVLTELKKPAQAEKMYQQAIRFEPNDAITYSDYGDLLASEGKLTDAVQQWTKAISLAPNLPYPHVSLAQEATLRGDVRTAIAHYRQAIALSQVGVNADWRLRLAWLEATAPDATQEEAEDAVAQAAKALENNPSPTPLELDTYAAALARAGQFDRAVELASRAAKESLISGNSVLSAAVKNRLEGYKQSRPFIQGSASSSATTRE